MQRPALIYGTAWKEQRTEELTLLALRCGFRAIDTANQRKHYVEAGVGAAVARAGIPRDELWLQTKYTYARGQDHRLPYDPAAPIPEQVAQSCARSLEHLGTTYIDSYVLHGPATAYQIVEADLAAWRAMEDLHATGKVRQLGISNVTAEQLDELCKRVRVAPAFVQNRCYASDGWDADVRAVCSTRGITYQGFSLLTANRRELQRPLVDEIAMRLDRTREQVVFRFAIQLGIWPLTGTTDEQHMRDDLAATDFELTPDDVRTLETIAS